HGNLGVQLVRMKQTEAAVSEFRTATELDPTWAGYPANLAYALLSLDRIGEAEEQARRAIALEPSNSGAHCVLGYILVRRPETRAQAIPHLRIGAREIPQAHYVLAQLLAQSGDSSSAKEEMDRFAAAGGISPEELKKWNAGLRHPASAAQRQGLLERFLGKQVNSEQRLGVAFAPAVHLPLCAQVFHLGPVSKVENDLVSTAIELLRKGTNWLGAPVGAIR